MKKLFARCKKADNTIYVVSGLPRSGTAMLMQILEAGGLSPLTDNARTADDDNHKGYYEFAPVKHLHEGNVAWVAAARGKVVKVISFLLPYLPSDHNYKVVFMRRAMPEILASQHNMLLGRGADPHKISDEKLASLYEKHLVEVCDWLRDQPNFSVLQVDYNQLLTDPAGILPHLNAFLGNKLDMNKMARVIDPNLYRQRTKSRDVRGETHAGDRENPGGGGDLEACSRSQTPRQARDRE
jgi:hypothetical protein